jgi:hypothetical protein
MEMMSSLVSNTLFEYFERKGETHSKINMACPFSLRQPIKDLKEFKMTNDIVGIPVNLNVLKDFDEALKQQRAFFRGIKNSLDPFGFMMSF